MSIFAGLGSAIIGGLGSLIGRKNASDDQWNLQKDAQDFNSREAEKQRQFNSREAELARQWQEDFYTQYQSPSAMMAQYRDAGINPTMVAGQGAGSPPSASSASGSAASSGIASAPGAANVIESIMGMMKLKSEIDNINADTENKKQQSEVYKTQAGLNTAVTELTNEQKGKIQHEINLLQEQASTEISKRELMAAQKAFTIAEKENISYSNALSKAFEDEFGYSAPESTINELISIVGSTVGSVVENIANPFNFIKAFKGRVRRGNKL